MGKDQSQYKILLLFLLLLLSRPPLVLTLPLLSFRFQSDRGTCRGEKKSFLFLLLRAKAGAQQANLLPCFPSSSLSLAIYIYRKLYLPAERLSSLSVFISGTDLTKRREDIGGGGGDSGDFLSERIERGGEHGRKEEILSRCHPFAR